MKDEINLLFLGGAKRVSLAKSFIAAGKKLKREVNIFSYELKQNLPIESVGTVILGKKWNDSNLYEHLLQIITEYNIQIVLPFVDPATVVCSKLKEQIKDLQLDACVLVSPTAVAETFFDKALAQKWFTENGFPIPESSDGNYPLIAKPRHGFASKGLQRISSIEEHQAFNAKFNSNDFIIERFIDGREYTADCYVTKERTIAAAVPRERIEVTGGESTRTKTVQDKEIVELCHQILNSGSFIGPITIQFIRDRTSSKLYVMEINTRFGGGIIASLEAGVDFTGFVIKEYLGEKIQEIKDWQQNLLMVRYFDEVFFNSNDQ